MTNWLLAFALGLSAGLAVLALIGRIYRRIISPYFLCLKCKHHNDKSAKFCAQCGKRLYTEYTAWMPAEAFFVSSSEALVIESLDGTFFVSADMYNWRHRTGEAVDHTRRIRFREFYEAATLASPIRKMENFVPTGEQVKLKVSDVDN